MSTLYTLCNSVQNSIDRTPKKTFKIMINFEDVTGENIQEQNPDWLQIPEHSYRILTVGGSGTTNALLELISHEPHIDKIFGSIRAEVSVSHKQV